jgi:hypothetical protein
MVGTRGKYITAKGAKGMRRKGRKKNTKIRKRNAALRLEGGKGNTTLRSGALGTKCITAKAQRECGAKGAKEMYGFAQEH